MPRSPGVLRDLVDLVLDGGLDELLRSWADAGVSSRAARRLLAQQLNGIELDERTILKWLRPYRDEAA